MKEKVFKVVTVTPLMLGNADKQPELRPPAVRASARYWLRATAGAVIGDANIPNLYKLESAVFGSTGAGSPISIQIPNKSLRTTDAYILPHHNKGKRSAFAAGELFEICLTARAAPDVIWNAALAALELSLAFGGLGLRSRRGYRTLRMESGAPITLAGWNAYLPQIVGKAVTAVQALAHHLGIATLGTPPAGPCSYPCASRESIIRVSQPPKQWDDAMAAVTGFMRAVHARGLTENIQYLGSDAPRQASPLWVRVVQMEDQKYRLLLITLPSIGVSNNTRLKKFLNDEFPGSNITVGGWNT